MAIRTVTRAGVGLVVGIIILAALVYAGLWFVRERGEQARREEAIAIADKLLEEESNQEVALDTDKDSESENSNQNNSNTENEADTTTNQPSSTTELPQTGPTEVTSALALGLMSFALVSFLHSRKALAKQL